MERVPDAIREINQSRGSCQSLCPTDLCHTRVCEDYSPAIPRRKEQPLPPRVLTEEPLRISRVRAPAHLLYHHTRQDKESATDPGG